MRICSVDWVLVVALHPGYLGLTEYRLKMELPMHAIHRQLRLKKNRNIEKNSLPCNARQYQLPLDKRKREHPQRRNKKRHSTKETRHPLGQ